MLFAVFVEFAGRTGEFLFSSSSVEKSVLEITIERLLSGSLRPTLTTGRPASPAFSTLIALVVAMLVGCCYEEAAGGACCVLP